MIRARAMLFDFGGTLASVGLGRCVRTTILHFAPVYGITLAPETIIAVSGPAAAQADLSFSTQPFYLFRDTFREGFRLTFERLGVDISPDQTAVMYAFLREQIARSDVRMVDGARETLAALRDRGLRLGIVSNVDEAEFAAVLSRSGLEDAVDFALSSEAAGSCKPDAGIFREALRCAGCAAGEALFVGDSPDQDIAGANRAGMRTVLYAGPRPAQRETDRRAGPTGDAQPHHIIHALSELLPLVDA